jgi:hypothetical protein
LAKGQSIRRIKGFTLKTRSISSQSLFLGLFALAQIGQIYIRSAG